VSSEVVLSVIIVNYNVSYFLEQALLSVRKAVEKLGAPVEVFVVDNNSVDGSVAMVRARFPEVILLENHDNPGFAKANNQALRQARGRYVLLLNPDTVVEEDTFQACCRFMEEHPDAGGLGVKMLDGRGQFLPESKRGLPTPWVAFYKIFGLAWLFPRSRKFGRYHLGFLDKDQTHPVDVLSGAFMLMRSEALAQVGLLDEDYFMYGEDIDLSYRLTQGGWKNYYYPGTRIIHYKGESTKRTSVNYVFVFYRAMVIFARKHFAPDRAEAFSLLLNVAIWLRALVAVVARAVVGAAPVLFDALLILGGMYLLKTYWEHNHRYVLGPYPPRYMLMAVPAYIVVWLTAAYFSGAYDRQARTSQVVRGVLLGTVLISAVSNFLDYWRFSKALIVLGGAWSVLALLGSRLLLQLARHGNVRLSQPRARYVAIVGSQEESGRVRQLLNQAAAAVQIIGYVSPEAPTPEVATPEDLLGEVRQLADIIRIYGVEELIFCGKDLSASQIMGLMVSLPQQPAVAYKILPQDSEYVIGSSSRDAPGDYYALDIALNLLQPAQRRNKRLLNVLSSVILLVGVPVLIWVQHHKLGYLRNCLRVLVGTRTWVGLRYASVPQRTPPAVLSPADSVPLAASLSPATRRRLELLYAKEYGPGHDVSVLLRCFRELGKEVIS